MCLTLLIVTGVAPQAQPLACTSCKTGGCSRGAEASCRSSPPAMGNTDFVWYKTEKESLQALIREKTQVRKTVPLLILE